MLTVDLKSVGNPDFGQNPEAPAPGCEPDTIARCADLADASRICREWIERNGLGGGNWTGGAVKRSGRVVARISYNGRIWAERAA